MRILCVVLLGVSVSLVGCAPKQMYSWENYSYSLYEAKKNATDEAVGKHKLVLLKIIETSKENNQRVPPGIYCEYGYILLKEGKPQEALAYFELEEKIYPESAVFIQKLKAQCTLADKEEK